MEGCIYLDENVKKDLLAGHRVLRFVACPEDLVFLAESLAKAVGTDTVGTVLGDLYDGVQVLMPRPALLLCQTAGTHRYTQVGVLGAMYDRKTKELQLLRG